MLVQKNFCTTNRVEQYVSDTAQIALSSIRGAKLRYKASF
jgi:hypothetical protein